MNSLETEKSSDLNKRVSVSRFEWIQLISTICIPIIIAIYTIVQNQSNQSIAESNRIKDIEIADASRSAEFETAKENRLNEIMIAEKSREKDRELSLDQQRQTILVEYHNFLTKILMEFGTTGNKATNVRLVIRFMTITALSQLDVIRKSLILRSLSEARLINLERKSQLFDESFLQLKRVDLTNTIFNLNLYSSIEKSDLMYNYWNYLWLPESILTNASFRSVFLDCSVFSFSYLDFADFSFATSRAPICFDNDRETKIDFSSTSLINATFYRANFIAADFSNANLTFTNMRYLYCRDCKFISTLFIHVDLSFLHMFSTFYKIYMCLFLSTTLNNVIIHSAVLGSINFTNSNWTNVYASYTLFRNNTLSYLTMKNCFLSNNKLYDTIFRNTTLYDIDMFNNTLQNVNFINNYMENINFSYIYCKFCYFTNSQLKKIIFIHASFIHSTFLHSHVNITQLIEEAKVLINVTLPNGTIIN
ncbi:unnamed protein product [Adineta ricciae]|uniref:Pentapeptide repeat-containing protein n=1 Tax=Adineta ricciae TaxID=249248 RepID=A0A815H676_ADIRI|nr:unnamed protein product [Adineta ricciae]CAF1350072.1 unnamed protein product [Adineta ricciae]